MLPAVMSRSLGWRSLESKQAAALMQRIREHAFNGFPPELEPRPAPLKSRRGFLAWTKTLSLWILMLHAWYIGSTGLCIMAFSHVDPAATTLMVYRKVSYGWKLSAPIPLRLKNVPAHIRSMLISVEDGKFYAHKGIDFEAFKRAREINARVGRPLYGGSTITMQVARSLFLVPVKSYLRKYLEVITALELELLLTKPRILELYFGYAEWGKGVFGLERASRSYFRASVSMLSRDKAARLVALLSSPILYTPATLEKSPILKERYRYLSQRFDPDSPFAEKHVEEEAARPDDAAASTDATSAPAAAHAADTAGSRDASSAETAPSAETRPAG